jgi:hypothetical protein
MSLTSNAPGVVPGAAVGVATPRRVRHQARDVVVLMAFSAGLSTTVALALMLVGHLARSGR